METKELIQWLRDNSSGAYRPAKEAAERMENMETALTQLSRCRFSDENCASFEVASKRVRNIATLGLK